MSATKHPVMMKIFTLWLPAACLVGAVVNAITPIPYFYEEAGLIENLTVFFLLASLVCLFRYGVRNAMSHSPLDKTLFVLLILGAIYFAGEELSWGQHFFDFATPEAVSEANYQHEMNLHNSKGLAGDLLDKLPRNILTFGIFLGGLIFPFCKSRLPEWIRRYVPGKSVVFVSVLVVFVSVPQKFFHHESKRHDGKRTKHYEARFDGGEMKEMYIAQFIFLFTLNFVRLLRDEREGETQRLAAGDNVGPQS